MSGKERHHYLSQFYLNGFGENGYIYRYDREQNKYKYLSTKDAGVIKNYHTVVKADGSKDRQSIEDYFQFIETKTAPVLLKIDKQDKINETEKVYLSIFVSYLMVRTPYFENFFNEMQDQFGSGFIKSLTKKKPVFEKIVSDYINETGNPIDYDIDEMIKQTERMKFFIPKEFRLQQMLDFGFQTSKLIFNMPMMIQTAVKDTSFITSDNPFIFWSEGLREEHESVGLLTPETSKVIPLTKKSCLILINITGGETFFEYLPEKASKASTRIINQTIAQYCERFIFGQDHALLKKIAESINLSSYKIKSRVKVYTNYEKGIFKTVRKNEIELKK